MPRTDRDARVARFWRGRVPAARSDAYQRYLLAAGVPPLEETALRVEVLRADCAEESEFVTISWWESVEAMSRFAGPDPRQIHHLPLDPEFLIKLPEAVQVLEVVRTIRD